MNLDRILAISMSGWLVACGASDAIKDPPSSRTSSFTLEEYRPDRGLPEWQTMLVSVERKDAPGDVKRTIKREQYSSGRFEEQSLTLEYGRYTMDLRYNDQAGKLVYRACDASKEHVIDVPSYEVSIKICPEKGDTPVGEVHTQPTSDVTIRPNAGGTDPNKPGVPAPSPHEPQQGGSVNKGNPFAGMSLYVNPIYSAQVEDSIQKEPALASKMAKLKNQSTAIWIDRIESIKHIEPTLSAIRKQQHATGVKTMATFVVYNLPERDCAALASAGELTAADKNRYKSEYIDVIAAQFEKYSDVKIAAIVEPDSLPNMATNMGRAKCVTAAPIYKEGVAYAIQKLGMTHVSLYLDTAHGGWLGWPDNRRKMAAIFKEVLDLAGGSHKIRGFASNVSNYSPLRAANPDPNPQSYYQGNPAIDELTFVQLLGQDLAAVGIENRHFIIDTSRNGRAQSRSTWGSWCNVSGAGIGERPTIAPAPGIDAYLWVKPPGESDGVATRSAARFDESCVSPDSFLGAPQAGVWFHDHFKSMVQNASPAL